MGCKWPIIFGARRLVSARRFWTKGITSLSPPARFAIRGSGYNVYDLQTFWAWLIRINSEGRCWLNVLVWLELKYPFAANPS